MSNKTNIDTCW